MTGIEELYDHENLNETFSSRIAEANDALENFLGLIPVLPPVDKDGHSDCAFAESVYADLEERREKVALLLERFIDYQAAIEHQIERVKRNHSLLEDAGSQLSREAPLQELSVGERAARAMLEDLHRKREQATEMIARLSAALEEGKEKQWPLGKPQKRIGGRVSGSDPGSSSHDPDAPPTPTVADELDSLTLGGHGGMEL